MRLFVGIALLSVAIFPATAAQASCNECKGPYGLTYYQFNGCPQGTVKTGTRPDSFCNIQRFEGYPYQSCIGGENYRTWLGGPSGGSVVVAGDGQTIDQGKVFHLLDGPALVCNSRSHNSDLKGGANFITVRTGQHRDILHIIWRDEAGKIDIKSEPIFDGRHHGIHTTPESIGRMYGVKKDLVKVYKVPRKKDEKFVTEEFRLPFGSDHQFLKLPGNTRTDIGILMGVDDDLEGRFCFSNSEWSFKQENPAPDDCLGSETANPSLVFGGQKNPGMQPELYESYDEADGIFDR